MADREELLRAAREKRETAARIRRLAQGLSLNADHERLMQQATEIEEEARQLERQVAEGDPTARPPVPRGMPMQTQQVQQQQQQQQQAEGNSGEKPPKEAPPS